MNIVETKNGIFCLCDLVDNLLTVIHCKCMFLTSNPDLGPSSLESFLFLSRSPVFFNLSSEFHRPKLWTCSLSHQLWSSIHCFSEMGQRSDVTVHLYL